MPRNIKRIRKDDGDAGDAPNPITPALDSMDEQEEALDREIEAMTASIAHTSDDDVRENLIRLSESGKIKQKVSTLKKASKTTIDKIQKSLDATHAEEESRVSNAAIDRCNEYTVNILIGRYSHLLESLGVVGSRVDLERDLLQNDLLKQDLVSIVKLINPYVPYTGIMFGGLTTAQHVYHHTAAKFAEAEAELPVVTPHVLAEEKADGGSLVGSLDPTSI